MLRLVIAGGGNFFSWQQGIEQRTWLVLDTHGWGAHFEEHTKPFTGTWTHISFHGEQLQSSLLQQLLGHLDMLCISWPVGASPTFLSVLHRCHQIKHLSGWLQFVFTKFEASNICTRWKRNVPMSVLRYYCHLGCYNLVLKCNKKIYDWLHSLQNQQTAIEHVHAQFTT